MHQLVRVLAVAAAVNRAAIRHFVEARHARNPREFGSVLRGEDTANSDLDVLVDPTPAFEFNRRYRAKPAGSRAIPDKGEGALPCGLKG